KSIIEFDPGLNVITGPSDTGKSFILECIDFALGKGSVPKSIDEAKGYETLILRIRSNQSGEIVELKRSILNVGAIYYKKGENEGRDIYYKHSGDKENISSVLL